MVYNLKKAVLGIFFLVAIVPIGYLIYGSIIARTIVSYTSYPFLVVQNRCIAPFKNIYDRIIEYQSLKDVLAVSQQENNNLKKELIRLSSLLDYTDSTQELRDFSQKYKTDYMKLAIILIKNLDDNGHFIIIDKGKSQNIKPDMIVAYKNCLIGKVCEVYDYYSKVMLITDRRCKVSAYCTQTNVCGIHEGINQTASTHLAFINHLETLREDDLILTSGEGLIFPRGFGIGRLTSFLSDGLHYQTVVKPLISVEEIDYCYVLAKGAELIEH